MRASGKRLLHPPARPILQVEERDLGGALHEDGHIPVQDHIDDQIHFVSVIEVGGGGQVVPDQLEGVGRLDVTVPIGKGAEQQRVEDVLADGPLSTSPSM